jgi:hypothetical protein
MNRLRYFILLMCLSPAILAASIEGYRQLAHDGFKEPNSPAWLESAKAREGAPRNLMEKTLLREGNEHATPRLKQGTGIHRSDTNEHHADSVSLRAVGLRIDK